MVSPLLLKRCTIMIRLYYFYELNENIVMFIEFKPYFFVYHEEYSLTAKLKKYRYVILFLYFTHINYLFIKLI